MKQLELNIEYNSQAFCNLVSSARINLKETSNNSLTKRNFAKIIGYSGQFYGWFESGKKTITKVYPWFKISKELCIPFDTLLKTFFCIDNEKVYKILQFPLNSIEENYDTVNYLSQALERQNITQEELARKIGCDQSHISHILKKDRKVDDIRLLYLFADYLNCSLFILIRNCLGISNEELLSVFFIEMQECLNSEKKPKSDDNIKSKEKKTASKINLFEFSVLVSAAMKGYKIVGFSELSGISVSWLSKALNNNFSSRPTKRTLRRLAEFSSDKSITYERLCKSVGHEIDEIDEIDDNDTSEMTSSDTDECCKVKNDVKSDHQLFISDFERGEDMFSEIEKILEFVSQNNDQKVIVLVKDIHLFAHLKKSELDKEFNVIVAHY